jgi:molybdate transport system substrate-binding protein
MQIFQQIVGLPMKSWLAFGVALAASLGLALGAAAAAELQVFGVAPVRSTVTALSTAYQQTSGTEVKPTVVASDIVEKSLAGKTFDVMVLSTPEMDEQQKLGRVSAGSRVKLARVGIGVAMRAGASKPDLSTPEKFREAMLAAKSIAYAASTKPIFPARSPNASWPARGFSTACGRRSRS